MTRYQAMQLAAGAMSIGGRRQGEFLRLAATAAALVLFASITRISHADPGPEKPSVHFVAPAKPSGRYLVEVRGLSREATQRFAEARPEQLQAVLQVRVAGSASPMFGEYSVEPTRLVFQPRFALLRGVRYEAEYQVQPSDPKSWLRVHLELAPPKSPPTRLVAVYPSSNLLPENQLKYYLHFSGPMSRGEAYRRIHLLHENGEEVETPFLELDEELWDASGTRFTLFFDPGRIKRGLKPREDVGPSLEEGKRYRLVIDKAWQDALGRPLVGQVVKRFSVGPPDDRQPDPKRWKFEMPGAGTRDPVQVRFDEPLDQAMLQRLRIVAKNDVAIAGQVVVDQEEQRWRFTPETAWAAGSYELVVDVNLEDRAGNSIGRPFEVDVVRPIETRVQAAYLRLPLRILDRRQ